MTLSPDTLFTFWFEETAPAQWWRVDPRFDDAIRLHFEATHEATLAGELDRWRVTTGEEAEFLQQSGARF